MPTAPLASHAAVSSGKVVKSWLLSLSCSQFWLQTLEPQPAPCPPRQERSEPGLYLSR